MAAPAAAAAAKALYRRALIRAAASRRSSAGRRLGCGCAAVAFLGAGAAGIAVLASFVVTASPLPAVLVEALGSAQGPGGPDAAAPATAAPLTCGGLQVSQGYGDTPYEHPHTGIDLVCPAGTPVSAVAGGTFHRRDGGSVPCAFPAGARGGLGAYGEVDSGEVQYLFGHMEGFALADGVHVEPGTVIGFEGSSGCSTGFHLHFEVHGEGRVTNPCPFLPPGYPAAHDVAGTRCWGSAPP